MLILLSSLAFAVDTDLDGVDNLDDECYFEDDTIDIDADGVADCAQTLLWEFGFADEASIAYYSDDSPFGPDTLVWGHDDDLNDYDAYSGAAMIANGYSAGVLMVDQCVTLDANTSYVVTGRLLSTADADYFLGPVFYHDPNCAQGWYTNAGMWGFSSMNHVAYALEQPEDVYVDLAVAFSRPASAGSMRVRAYIYNREGSSRFWFDSIAVHEAGAKPRRDDGPPGPPSTR
ncbi:MAG: hypothetical protein Q8P41_17360 [Pseudomonadota bacterium]|nr:hypothetical protein [Pseudomonadota bacterium]